VAVRTAWIAVSTVALLLALGAAYVAQAASPQEVIDILNRQRAANGIPAGLVEDARLSRACALHNRYLRLNPDAYPHSEKPGQPGYTSEGAAIAPSSVLTEARFESGRNPFQYQPFHLEGLLRPELRVTGVSESDGWTCVVVRDPRERRPPRGMRFYSYPGPARGGVPTEDVAWNEAPYAPGDLVGIPQGTVSGPHLFLFGFGLGSPQLRVRSASLRGPAGAVALRVVDNTHPRALLAPPSAILIPPTPLEPGAYCATVRGTMLGEGRFLHRWPFVTEGSNAGPSRNCAPPPYADLRLVRVRRIGSRVSVLVGVNRRARGRLTVTVNAGPRPRRLSRTGRPRRRGRSTVHAFAGTLPTAPGARWILLEVSYRRTDGGTDARTGRALRARG
jgi:hypothetical protein